MDMALQVVTDDSGDELAHRAADMVRASEALDWAHNAGIVPESEYKRCARALARCVTAMCRQLR